MEILNPAISMNTKVFFKFGGKTTLSITFSKPFNHTDEVVMT